MLVGSPWRKYCDRRLQVSSTTTAFGVDLDPHFLGPISAEQGVGQWRHDKACVHGLTGVRQLAVVAGFGDGGNLPWC